MMGNIGLAVMTETPCVIVDVQRGGPSTGLPTAVSQADVMQARWGSHGDYELIALSPSSPQEIYDLTITAFNLAEEYRVPVIILADEAVAEVVTAGASPATDAASVAASCNVLLTSLPRPDHVEAVMEGAGALAALRPGSCWVDLTTNRRDLVLRLADAAPDGVAVADSPLTGAVDGARNGRLTLFIGGMLGGVVGMAGHYFFPEIVHQPEAYVLVGMAAFFAGAAKAPLGAMLMVSEMTLSYSLLPPLMLVSVIAIIFNRKVSIYEKQVPNKFASPAHESDVTVNVMSEFTVADVFQEGREFITLTVDTKFAQLQKIISRTRQNVFPVTDEEGRLAGVLSFSSIRTVLFEDSLKELLVVGELATAPVSLTRDQDLYAALITFLDSGYSQLPVVDYEEGRQRVLGMLNHEDVIAAYHREVSRRMQAE
jgi:CBS domain-containing protein